MHRRIILPFMAGTAFSLHAQAQENHHGSLTLSATPAVQAFPCETELYPSRHIPLASAALPPPMPDQHLHFARTDTPDWRLTQLPPQRPGGRSEIKLDLTPTTPTHSEPNPPCPFTAGTHNGGKQDGLAQRIRFQANQQEWCSPRKAGDDWRRSTP